MADERLVKLIADALGRAIDPAHVTGCPICTERAEPIAAALAPHVVMREDLVQVGRRHEPDGFLHRGSDRCSWAAAANEECDPVFRLAQTETP